MTVMKKEEKNTGVLAEPYEVIAATLRAHPGVWYLVGTGERDRLSVFGQTAYRIRRNRIAAFATGRWEVRVSSQQDGRPEGEAVQMYVRFMPPGVA